MTNILVCVKRAPDPTGEVVLTDDGLRVDGRYAGYTTSAHEESAVALAVQLTEGSDAMVTVLSVGSQDSIEQIRAGIAVGATDGILVEADADLLGLFQKKIKQRQESVELYDKGGRAELAAQEREEIAIISAYLPKQMSDDEVKAAISAAIAETGAAGMKDMGSTSSPPVSLMRSSASALGTAFASRGAAMGRIGW